MIICPKCGARSDQKEFINAFCIDCFEFKVKYTKNFEFDICIDCGRIKLQGQWRKQNPQEFSEYIKSKCKGDFSEVKFIENKLTFTIDTVAGQRILEKDVDIKYNKKLCSDCGRVHGGYFEAIIQLRGDKGLVERYAKKIVDMIQKYSFVSNVENIKEGVDVYSGNTRESFKILSIMKLKYHSTKKLFGIKDGHRIYRTTFAVRLEKDMGRRKKRKEAEKDNVIEKEENED
ncbi:MAG: NMD3-related protein [Candidatus Micrarchaeota archaeon]